jgi:UDP:flavonoid glycosyltransferase YjiC (YdhE family)
MSRVLLATFGSLGDLHPYLAIGRELVARGHRVTLGTHGVYEQRARDEGLEFVAVPPDLTDFGDPQEVMAKAMNGPDGSRYVIETMVLPYVGPAYAALKAAAVDADVIVGHPLTFAVSSVAEKLGRAWVSSALQPVIMFSASDPSVYPIAPWLEPIARRLPAVQRGFLGLATRVMRTWMKPLDDVRRGEGLTPLTGNAVREASFSPWGHLVLFSPELAAPQPDWPASSIVCGFPFHDRDEAGRVLPLGLEEFLAAGDPPLVFTLGSSAVHLAGDFYEVSLRAAQRLGRRALLLVGRETQNALPDPLPSGIAAFDYVPFSQVLPRGAATIHQGGVGTTAQAMRAGRPMLVVPFAHDQYDHAARITRRGLGLSLERSRYDVERVSAVLGRLLGEPSFALCAAEVGARVRAERGTAAAADAIEQVMAAASPPGR